jgi:hypothetical protein
VRVVLGVIFFDHGAQKVFGCFGGPGLRGIISYVKQSLGIPAAFTVLAAFTECFEGPFMLDLLVARGSSDRSQTRPWGPDRLARSHTAPLVHLRSHARRFQAGWQHWHRLANLADRMPVAPWRRPGHSAQSRGTV